MLLMAHEGAHEFLLRTPSSRTGNFGGQSSVDLRDTPHLKFRYMLHNNASRGLGMNLPGATCRCNMAVCLLLINCILTCLPLSNPTPKSSRELQRCKGAQHIGICVPFTMFAASAGTKERDPCWASPLSQPPSALTVTVLTI